MATIKTTFLSTDGKEFATAAEADRHDLGLKLDAELNQYVETLNLKSESAKGLTISRNRIKKNILNFLAWRESGVTASEANDDEAVAVEDQAIAQS